MSKDIFPKMFATVFEPLEYIAPDKLLVYAEAMRHNAQDNIEHSIAETIMRFARLRQMTQAIIDEKE